MPPGFRTINNPYLTPLGAQLVIAGVPQFNAAAINVQRQFTAIGQTATAVAAQITALNTSLAAFNTNARVMQTIGARAQRVAPVSAAARGIPAIAPRTQVPGLGGGRRAGSNPLAALGGIDTGGQARAFFGQRAGPLSIYTKLPITLNATVVAAAAAAAAITGLGAQLQRTARQVQVFGGTTDQQMDNIRKAAVGMSREFTAGANDVAQGALQLSKAGAPINDLNNNVLRSVVVLNQASQGEVDLTAASDTLVQGITALNLEWSESPKFVGALIAAVQGSTASFSDFTLQLKQTLPIAGLLKFNYDELFASLALLNQAGLRGSIAGTALKNALIAIADPTSEAAEILEKYNISLFDAEGKSLPLIEILGRLTDAFNETTSDISDAQRFFETTDIFNTRQILAALSVINQGEEAYAGFLNTVRGGINTGEEVARALQNNLIDQLKLVWNNITAAAEAVSGEFLPALTKIASGLRESMSDGNLQGFRNFGATVRDIITSNNEFVNSLTVDVMAGVNVATEGVQKLISTIRGVSGAEITWQSVGDAILETSHSIRDSVIIVGVVLEVLSEELLKLSTSTLPTYRSEIDNTVAATKEWLEANQGVAQGAASVLEAYLKFSKDRWVDFGAAVLLVLRGVERGLQTHIQVDKELFAALTTVIDTYGAPAFVRFQEAASQALAYLSANVSMQVGAIAAAVRWLVNEVTISLNNFLATFESLTGIAIPRVVSGVIEGVKTDVEQAREEVEEGLGKVAAGVTDGLVAPFEEGLREAANRITTETKGFVDRVNERTDAAIAEAERRNAERRRSLVPDMPNSMGFWDEVPGVTRRPTGSLRPGGGGGGSTFPPSKDGGGGKGSDADELKKLAAIVRNALSGIPALTDELVDFIAEIAQDAPQRLQPMLAAINNSKGIIADLVVAKRNLLQTDLQLIAIEKNLTDLTAQSAKIDIERAIATIGFDKQLIGLNQQLLVIDRQRWPIEDAIRLIDREIAKLGQENLVAKRALLEIDLEELPARQRMEDIEKEISKLNRTNFDLERQRVQTSIDSIELRNQIADLDEEIGEIGKTNFAAQREQLKGDLEALPIRRQIRDIENQITDTVDKRAGIRTRLAELDLADTEDALASAWEKNDVATIIRLEEQKAAQEAKLKGDEKAERSAERVRLGLELQRVELEDQLKPIERRLELLADTEEQQRLLDEISRTFLEEEKQRLEALLKPHDDIIKLIERQSEIEKLRAELAILALEQEKQLIEDQLEPLENKRLAIEREVAIENLRNQITITHLEEEKRRLEEQLIPLEDQRIAIERIKQEVEFLKAAAQVEFEERSIQIKQMILQEELRQAELEATRREQEKVFGDLVLGFADSLIASGAFTAQESLEVAQRLKLWDDSIAKLAETIVEFQRLSGAAGDAARSIKEIERDVTVTITTVHKTVYESSGAPPAKQADPGVQQFAGGGIVPGRRGEPMLIMAHGGERIISVTSASTPAHVSARQVGSVTNNIYNYETNYNVNPSYSEYQSPASLTDDLRALVMASSRG